MILWVERCTMNFLEHYEARASFGSLLERYDRFVEDSEPDDPRRTPAPRKDRIKGSKKNPKGSASSAKSGASVKFSAAVEKGLRNKIREYNDEMKDRMKSGKSKEKHKVTMGMLKAVFRRGLGAFSSSHLPGMSRNGWAYARVNAFLHLVKTGRPKKKAYVQDNDLLPSSHPRHSKNESTLVDLEYYRMLQEHARIEDFDDDLAAMRESLDIIMEWVA